MISNGYESMRSVPENTIGHIANSCCCCWGTECQEGKRFGSFTRIMSATSPNLRHRVSDFKEQLDGFCHPQLNTTIDIDQVQTSILQS